MLPVAPGTLRMWSHHSNLCLYSHAFSSSSLIVSCGVYINWKHHAVWGEVTFCTSPIGACWDLKLVIVLEVKRGNSCRFGGNWEDLSRLQTPGKPLHYNFLDNSGLSPRQGLSGCFYRQRCLIRIRVQCQQFCRSLLIYPYSNFQDLIPPLSTP